VSSPAFLVSHAQSLAHGVAALVVRHLCSLRDPCKSIENHIAAATVVVVVSAAVMAVVVAAIFLVAWVPQ
jgi:hypothetical protein